MKTIFYEYLPIKVSKAKGLYLFDKNNKPFLDTFMGIGVHLFGHQYEPIMSSIKNKLSCYTHLSNFFRDVDQDRVASILLKNANMSGGVYFSNSGTEAAEAAIRSIKKNTNHSKSILIHLENSFHGRTCGSLSLMGHGKTRSRFNELLPNTRQISFNSCDEIHRLFEQKGSSVAAFFIETIQGAGGVQSLSEEFISVLKYYHNKYKFTLVCDEIQSGLGRTGYYFSFQKYSLKPDIILCGKGIGGGLPLAATILSDKITKEIEKGDHGSTFAPNPVSLAAAKVVLELIPTYLRHVQETEIKLKTLIREELSAYLDEWRIYGCMVGLDVKDKYLTNLQQIALEKENILINILQSKTIRLLLPLNTSYEEWSLVITKIRNALRRSLCYKN